MLGVTIECSQPTIMLVLTFTTATIANLVLNGNGPDLWGGRGTNHAKQRNTFIQTKQKVETWQVRQGKYGHKVNVGVVHTARWT